MAEAEITFTDAVYGFGLQNEKVQIFLSRKRYCIWPRVAVTACC